MRKIATKAEWEEVKNGRGDKLIAVDFTAKWCGPCKMIGPKFEAMETEFPDVIFCKIDVDENSDAAEAEGVSAMPTFKFFKNGGKVDELVGADEGNLRALIKKYK